MITLKMLDLFIESLPSADGDNRGRTLSLKYKERDAESDYRSPEYPKQVPAKFQSTYVANEWRWVYVGEVIMAWGK